MRSLNSEYLSGQEGWFTPAGLGEDELWSNKIQRGQATLPNLRGVVGCVNNFKHLFVRDAPSP